MALTFDKVPSKILTNQLSSIEDASLASIVTFKTVSVKVNEIKMKLGLNENGDEWREKVNEIGKKKKKKIEKETNKNRNKERKEAHKKSKELIKKRDEWLVENIDTVDEVVENEEGEDDEEDAEALQTPSVKPKKISTNPIAVNNKTKKLAKKTPNTDSPKTANPFFLTVTGETYLATKIIDRIQPSGPNDGLDRRERRAQQLGGASKPKPISKRQYDMPSSSAPITLKKSIAIPTDLHPSWAAKLKSKGIDKFQGKKMKFNDDNDDDDKPSNNVGKSSSTHSGQPNDDQEKIHPSWAAKQKLKPVISEFKGSKIVFDD